METKITFSILFWLNVTKSKNGVAPIYARVTVNSRRAEISLKRSYPVFSWDNNSHRVRGRNAEKTTINAYLDRIYSRLLDCQEALQKKTSY